MSAPPIAITMWMPKRSETTVITMSGVMPAATSFARMNSRPYQTMTTRPRRLIQWRAGSSRGLPPILPESLPKATSEPEKVTAPMRMPR